MATQLKRQGTYPCCGMNIDALTPDEALDRLWELTEDGNGRAVHLCNAYTLASALRDPALRAAIRQADLRLPDGMPVIWVGRRAGFPQLRRRVYGPDLMTGALCTGQALGIRHYLYGSTPQVINALVPRLAQLAPRAEVVGAESPPFRPLRADEEVELVERIRLAQPDVVWIGLGTPLQDLFVARFRDRLGATLVAVGAAFDFIAGTKPQAPVWLQDRGLEWAFRLATEPRRLWRRYLFGNARFLAATWRQLLGV